MAGTVNDKCVGILGCIGIDMMRLNAKCAWETVRVLCLSCLYWSERRADPGGDCRLRRSVMRALQIT